MAKIGHSEFFQTILMQKVSALHQPNRISTVVTETAAAIAITKIVTKPVAIANVSGNGFTQCHP